MFPAKVSISFVFMLVVISRGFLLGVGDFLLFFSAPVIFHIGDKLICCKWKSHHIPSWKLAHSNSTFNSMLHSQEELTTFWSSRTLRMRRSASYTKHWKFFVHYLFLFHLTLEFNDYVFFTSLVSNLLYGHSIICTKKPLAKNIKWNN